MSKKQITSIDMWRKYRKLFAMYCQHTNEYQKIAIYLEHLMKSRNLRRNAFLDVGAGSGTLTFSIGRYFGHVVAIEPNPLFCHDLKTKATTYGKQIHLVRGFWPSLDLGEECYDLVLCTHVFYYIDVNLWGKSIRQMLSYLNPGGSLVVILASCKSELPTLTADIIKVADADVTEGEIWAEDLVEVLKNQGLAFTTYELTATMSTKSPKIAGEILAFLTSRGKIFTPNYEVSLIRASFQKEKGVYGLRIVDKILTLTKDPSTIRKQDL